MALTWPQTRDIITIGSAGLMVIVTLIFGVSLLRLWQQAQDIGTLKADVVTLARDVGAIKNDAASSMGLLTTQIADLGKGLTATLASVETRLASLEQSASRIEGRMTDLDLDPALRRGSGIPGVFDAHRRQGERQTIRFSTDGAAQVALMLAGLDTETIAPGVIGYPILDIRNLGTSSIGLDPIIRDLNPDAAKAWESLMTAEGADGPIWHVVPEQTGPQGLPNRAPQDGGGTAPSQPKAQ